ncbi:mercury resistance system periplasmic binding protein MerP [Inquilinus sp. CAU 1745]|uniref:mercury resistance system periplasmic binding protein MerP n=1 Tax=Inquilinus sp. CAU 1745 TaxID=3140369 RepID=UPI00325BB33B
MKHLIGTVLAALSLVSGTAAAAERTIRFAVENMTCATCPIVVRESLEAVPGVGNVEVSFEEKSAVVTFDDAKATVAALVDATTNAGFPSRPMP